AGPDASGSRRSEYFGHAVLEREISDTALAMQYGMTAKLRPIAAEEASCGAPLAARTPNRTIRPPRTEPMIVRTQKKLVILHPPSLIRPLLVVHRLTRRIPKGVAILGRITLLSRPENGNFESVAWIPGL